MADKIKVAMIDDEQELCLLVKGNLEDTGEFDVITSNDPQGAEDFIRREKPDLILLDNVMPKRLGSDIAKKLKKDDETRRIPIIMVSGKGEMVYNKKREDFQWIPNNPITKERGKLPDVKGSEALSEAYGVDDYVSKPFATGILVEVIKEVLSRRKKPSQEGQQES